MILLIEDNPDDEALTLRALRKTGTPSEITVAHDGVEAVDYLEACQPHSMPALVLLDLKMPRLDGLQVLEWIRGNERTRRLPVVVLTSSIEELDRIRAYDLGVNSYVQKPVDFSRFVAAVHQLVNYWFVLNQPAP